MSAATAAVRTKSRPFSATPTTGAPRPSTVPPEWPAGTATGAQPATRRPSQQNARLSSLTWDATTAQPGRSAGSRPAAMPKLRTPTHRSTGAAPERGKQALALPMHTERRAARDRGFERQPARHDQKPAAFAHMPCPDASAVRAAQTAIAGQRPEREIFGVAVVAQIEDARKTGAAVVRLAPEPVVLLAGASGTQRPRFTAHARRRRRPSARATPRRSAKRCFRRARGRHSRAGSSDRLLAPAAVLVLDREQPTGRVLHLRRPGGEAGGVQCAQHRPGPIDVVDPPASVPRALRPLRAAKVIEPACAGPATSPALPRAAPASRRSAPSGRATADRAARRDRRRGCC